jgi:HK97 family phage prohead protease
MNIQVVRQKQESRPRGSVVIVRRRHTPPVHEPQLPEQVKRQAGKLYRCDMTLGLDSADSKAFTAIKTGEKVTDYENVTIRGYLSTWQHVTPTDRDGDYVIKGAFTDTIPRFMKNPVLLVNHKNSVDSIAGKFLTVKEDDKGLYVEARITDSPAEWAKDIRWKVANGELQTMSMGGFFFYGEGEMRNAIMKVSLFEGSLTPVPSNPDAVFSIRECTESEMQKAAELSA